jgi:hypothetical protein
MLDETPARPEACDSAVLPIRPVKICRYSNVDRNNWFENKNSILVAHPATCCIAHKQELLLHTSAAGAISCVPAQEKAFAP